ncbi:MAG: hypothetical protein WA974_09850 [Thermodesulfobacteriota bacterium]
MLAPKFKAPLEAGKAWFEAELREETELSALKLAVSKVSASGCQMEKEKGF